MAEKPAARWYVDACAVETRIAKLIDGRLVSLKLIPHVMPALARPQVDDVYLARIAKTARGMRGQFVDLGNGGEGLLRTKDALAEGQLVLARVTQSAYGSKLAVLKVDAGAGDVDEMERHPHRISSAAEAAKYIAARIQKGEEVVVDSDRAWRGPKAESAKPGLFEREGIEAQIEAALGAVVPLACGGRLIVEQTQALTAIDVDAGSAARASEANAEAAIEIPYQISARSLAGNIVIDFAQIGSVGEIGKLKERIGAEADAIGLKLQIGIASRTGLLELQCPRAEAPLAALLTESGVTHSAVPARLNLEAQAARLSRAVRIAASRMPGALDLHVGAPLADWLLRGAGQEAWEAIQSACPAVLHLVPGGLDDAISVERSPRSAS